MKVYNGKLIRPGIKNKMPRDWAKYMELRDYEQCQELSIAFKEFTEIPIYSEN